MGQKGRYSGISNDFHMTAQECGSRMRMVTEMRQTLYSND
jgi:hypothetical protein